LLTSILGVSRMMFSMSRRNDLPKTLSRVHERFCTPYVSVLAVGAAMTLLVLFVDLANVVAVSTFALLFWYFFANFASFRLKMEKRLFPKFLPLLGMVTCLTLLAVILIVAQLALMLGVSFLLVGALLYSVKRFWNKRPGATV